MASWGNSENNCYPQDMDSNGQKLTVRNAVSGPTTNFRAEIAERAHPLQPHNALKINGDVVLDYYSDDNQDLLAGSLTVEPDGLFINSRIPGEGSTNGDPAVHLGWHTGEGQTLQGNHVYIDGKEIGIGPGQSPITDYPVALKGPVKIPGVSSLGCDLFVEGRIWTKKVDVQPNQDPDERILRFGGDTASKVKIGKRWQSEEEPGCPTEVLGMFSVAQSSQFMQDVSLQGNTVAVGPLEVRNHATVLGNVTVAETVNATTLVAQSGIECTGAASLTASKIKFEAHTEMLQEQGNQHVLRIEHNAWDNQVAALHVSNNGTLGNTVGGYFHANRAVVADGEVYVKGASILNGDVTIQGDTLHEAPVRMQGKSIIMGGSDDSEVLMVCGDKRLEFHIGGKLRFYIDESGGHNAE